MLKTPQKVKLRTNSTHRYKIHQKDSKIYTPVVK